jgi:hypothetical protein
MSIECEVIVDRTATSEQLAILGAALWAWCCRTWARPGIYTYLDSQVLADLIAGTLPTKGQSPRQSEQRADGVHFKVFDNDSPDRQSTVTDLRRE